MNDQSLVFSHSYTMRLQIADQFRTIISNIEDNLIGLSYCFKETNDQVIVITSILDQVILSLIQTFDILTKLSIIKNFYLNQSTITQLTEFRQFIIKEIFPNVKDVQGLLFLELDGYPFHPNEKRQLFGDLLDNNDIENAKTVLLDPYQYKEAQSSNPFRTRNLFDMYSKYITVVNTAILLNQLIQFGNEYDSKIEKINAEEEKEKNKYLQSNPSISLKVVTPEIQAESVNENNTETADENNDENQDQPEPTNENNDENQDQIEPTNENNTETTNEIMNENQDQIEPTNEINTETTNEIMNENQDQPEPANENNTETTNEIMNENQDHIINDKDQNSQSIEINISQNHKKVIPNSNVKSKFFTVASVLLLAFMTYIVSVECTFREFVTKNSL